MLLRFYTYGTNDRLKRFEGDLVAALGGGALACGDRLEAVPAQDFRDADLADVAVMVGLRAHTREVVDAYRAAGRRTIVLDKGAIRVRNASDYVRVYLDGGSSLAYLMRERRPPDRWEALQIDAARPRRTSRSHHVLYANNSQKVHDYWRLGSADELTERTFALMRRMAPRRPMVFRPKPRAMDFREVEDVRTSVKPETIEDALENCHVLVTYTSHCSVNAVLAGVPVVALGPNPAAPIAGKYLEQILDPPVPDEAARDQWLFNMAYAQWTEDELASGEAWEFIRGEIEATLPQQGEPTRCAPTS